MSGAVPVLVKYCPTAHKFGRLPAIALSLPPVLSLGGVTVPHPCPFQCWSQGTDSYRPEVASQPAAHASVRVSETTELSAPAQCEPQDSSSMERRGVADADVSSVQVTVKPTVAGIARNLRLMMTSLSKISTTC
jgi:hypothetical protein